MGISHEKWIPVANGLPEEKKAVLVSLRSGLVTVAYWYFLRHYKGVKTWQLYGPIQDIFDLETESVTHWQPLPCAPSGK